VEWNSEREGANVSSLIPELALLVVTTLVSVAAVIVGVGVSREWGRPAVAVTLGAVLLLNGVALVVQVVKVWREAAREAAILARKEKLVKLLGEELDQASNIEYRLESLMTRSAMNQAALNGFAIEIETWRTRVGNQLEELLPATYAARVFLSARGDFPGAYVFAGGGVSAGVAMTPGFYQYTHVRECRRALTAVLASVDSFARLSADLKVSP